MDFEELLEKEREHLNIDFSDTLHESLLSKEDFTYQFEEWKQGNIDHLYVTGLSGGGKSTLARDLAQQYNAEYIEDDFTIWYADDYGYDLEYVNFELMYEDEEKVWAVWEDILDRRIRGKRAVIESIWVPFYDWRRFPNNAVYIVKTGRLKATYRGAKRDEVKSPLEYLMRFFDTKEYWNKITELENYLRRLKA